MIGMTMTSPAFRGIAVEAQKRFEAATGLPSFLVSIPTERNYLAKLELWKHAGDQTVVYFDADLWFIQKCDLSEFEDQEDFIAVKDPGIYDPKHFPHMDSITLGLDVERYFNSGMMIWNKRHNDVFVKALELYDTHKKELKDFGEQSVLNAAAQRLHNVRLISNSFNYMPFAEKEKLQGMAVMENPLTIHGAGYGHEHKQSALDYYSAHYSNKFR